MRKPAASIGLVLLLVAVAGSVCGIGPRPLRQTARDRSTQATGQTVPAEIPLLGSPLKPTSSIPASADPVRRGPSLAIDLPAEAAGVEPAGTAGPIPAVSRARTGPTTAESPMPVKPAAEPTAAPSSTPEPTAVEPTKPALPAELPAAVVEPTGEPTTAPPPTAPPPTATAQPALLPRPAAGSLDSSTQDASGPPDRLVAPSIGLDTKVVAVGWHDTVGPDGSTQLEWDVASYAAGWHKSSALPGAQGNIVIAGHSNIEGEVFRHLGELNVGDPIEVFAGEREFDYRVEEKFVVAENAPIEERLQNARWIGPFPDARLTLLTCWPPNNNTHRIFVIARPAPAG